MKNKALRILVSVASVLCVILSGYFLFGIFSIIPDTLRSYPLFLEENEGAWRAYLTSCIILVSFQALTGLCAIICGAFTFLYVNSFLGNDSRTESKDDREMEKVNRDIQKKERKRERKKQLLEKLKSELGEE